jgi:hypothetical protein
MMMLAPVAVDLGWLLVSNSASLPVGPEAVLARYREAAERAAGAWLPIGPPWLGGRSPSVGPELERFPTSDLTLPPRSLEPTIGDWDAQVDLTWIVGLLLRGWRKGLYAEEGVVLGSGASAAVDLAWWCERALEAAARRL